MKKLSLFVASIFTAILTFAQGAEFPTDVDELALIYCGSQHRPDWNKELFYHYVVHEYADGKVSWMFDSFLMIEFMKWDSKNEQVSFGEYNAFPARQDDWLDLLDNQLGTKDGLGCTALDELIGELIPRIGKPGRKHKVVLTMPSAELTSGNDWGIVRNRKLNFQSEADRLIAQKWYVDRILEKWNECNFKNLELEGIYWVKESCPENYHNVVKQTNAYAHDKGLYVYWIPYFTADSRFQWKELGVDVAILQPNYYFELDKPYSRLVDAVENAYTYEMGLEIEFEAYNYSWTPGGERVKYPRHNCGLYDYSPVFYNRLVDYVEYFAEQQVYEYMPVAYYAGFQAVYDFMTSGNKKDHEIMDRLASLMNFRHVLSGFDVEPHTAGITDITNGDVNVAYAVDGGIYVSDNAGDGISIYTVDGREIYTVAKNAERLNYGKVYECPRGIYIVRVGGDTFKVAVK